MSSNIIPNLKGYSGVERLKFWAYKMLPLVYDSSLSYYELLCKVLAKLNDVISDLSISEYNIKELNDSFIELQNYVNEWFEGGAGYEYISEVVAEWIEAHPEIVTTVENKSLTIQKFSNQLLNEVSYGVSQEVSPIYMGDFIGTTPKYGISACCKVGNLIYCVETYDNALSEQTNLGYIRVFDVANNVEITDGFPAHVEVGHGNSICYDAVNECFYLVPLYDYTGGASTPVNHIIRYNSNFTQKAYITIDISPVGFMGVSYDYVNSCVYGFRYDGKVYKLGANGFELYTTIQLSEADGIGNYLQDFAVYNDIWYLSAPNGKIMYGLLEATTSHINGNFKVSRIDANNNWRMAEMEGFEFDRYGHLICSFFAFNSFVCDNFVMEVPTSNAIPYYEGSMDITSLVDQMYYTTSIASRFRLDSNQFRHPSCIEFMVRIPKQINFLDDFTSTNAIEFSNDIEVIIDGCTVECEYVYLKSCCVAFGGKNSGVLKLTGTGRGLFYPWISSTIKLKSPLKLNLTQLNANTGNFVLDANGCCTFFSDIPTTDITIGNANTMYVNSNAYTAEKLYYGNTQIN